MSTRVSRPIVVTVLAILAGVLAVLAGIHVLQALAILPYFIGPFAVRTFSLWYAIMWGMMVWVYAWLVKMLWEVDPQAWLFLVMITIFNLIMDFFVMLSATVTWSDVSVSFLINALVLIYCMLPSTRRAFAVE